MYKTFLDFYSYWSEVLEIFGIADFLLISQNIIKYLNKIVKLLLKIITCKCAMVLIAGILNTFGRPCKQNKHVYRTNCSTIFRCLSNRHKFLLVGLEVLNIQSESSLSPPSSHPTSGIVQALVSNLTLQPSNQLKSTQ
jgi:hypothetical protein